MWQPAAKDSGRALDCVVTIFYALFFSLSFSIRSTASWTMTILWALYSSTLIPNSSSSPITIWTVSRESAPSVESFDCPIIENSTSSASCLLTISQTLSTISGLAAQKIRMRDDPGHIVRDGKLTELTLETPWRGTWFYLEELERGVNFNEAPVKEAIEISFDIFKENKTRNKEVKITKTKRKRRESVSSFKIATFFKWLVVCFSTT